MSALSRLIGGLVALLLVSFGLYLLGLRALPTAERLRTRTYDRLGCLAGTAENPDYHENPGELAEAAPGGAAAPRRRPGTSARPRASSEPHRARSPHPQGRGSVGEAAGVRYSRRCSEGLSDRPREGRR